MNTKTLTSTHVENNKDLLTTENYTYSYYSFGTRQAGVNLIFSDEEQCFIYNAYCIETKLLKELLSNEFSFLDDALNFINEEFKDWEVLTHEDKKGCGSCAAHK